MWWHNGKTKIYVKMRTLHCQRNIEWCGREKNIILVHSWGSWERQPSSLPPPSPTQAYGGRGYATILTSNSHICLSRGAGECQREATNIVFCDAMGLGFRENNWKNNIIILIQQPRFYPTKSGFCKTVRQLLGEETYYIELIISLLHIWLFCEARFLVIKGIAKI